MHTRMSGGPPADWNREEPALVFVSLSEPVDILDLGAALSVVCRGRWWLGGEGHKRLDNMGARSAREQRVRGSHLGMAVRNWDHRLLRTDETSTTFPTLDVRLATAL